MELKLWEGAENYSGEDYSDYYVGFAQSRDSDAMAQSNFATALEKLGGEHEPEVIVARFSHWGSGWIEAILVQKDAKDKVAILKGLIDQYNEYPLLDESDFSQRENEEIDETFESNKDRFVTTLEEILGLQQVSAEDKAELEQVAKMILEWSAGYAGNENAWVDAKQMKKMGDHDWKQIASNTDNNKFIPLLQEALKKDTTAASYSLVESLLETPVMSEVEKILAEEADKKIDRLHISDEETKQIGVPWQEPIPVGQDPKEAAEELADSMFGPNQWDWVPTEGDFGQKIVEKGDEKRVIEPSGKRQVAKVVAHEDIINDTESESGPINAQEVDAIDYAKQYEEHMKDMLNGNPKALTEINGIQIWLETDPAHGNAIGIHLMDPDDRDLEDALETAERDGYPNIWIKGELPPMLENVRPMVHSTMESAAEVEVIHVFKDGTLSATVMNGKYKDSEVVLQGQPAAKKGDKFNVELFRDAEDLLSAKNPQKVHSSVAEDLDEFTHQYLVTILWATDASGEQGGDPLDQKYTLEDFAPEALEKAKADCVKFQEENLDDLSKIDDLGTAGHDFWLTRNGHGAGFWDGDYPEEMGKRLTEASKKFGSQDATVGDDEKIYLE